MRMTRGFAARADGPEWMELPGRDEARTWRTYRQFRLINALFSRHRAILKRWVLDDMQREPNREYHLADLGAGGLDIAHWLAGAARRRGLKLRITAVEGDALVVQRLRQTRLMRDGIEVVCEDAFAWLRVGPPVDYVFCNHFLHHLADEAVNDLLTLLARVPRRRFIISDLARSRWSYLGFALFGGLFLHRSYARADGLISIRRGFRRGELERALHRAGQAGQAQVHSLAPGRLVVVSGPGAVERDALQRASAAGAATPP
jgi:2-polyprenyl-3-methyl-5-hydroxy-6-metoxy-1,4-benzoquinol methylase